MFWYLSTNDSRNSIISAEIDFTETFLVASPLFDVASDSLKKFKNSPSDARLFDCNLNGRTH